MKKLLGIVVLGLLLSGNVYAQIITLNKCYMIKWDGDVIYNDKVWSRDHWNEENIVDQEITNFYEAKEFIPNDMTYQQFIDITLSCTNTGGCSKRATDFLNKYDLYKKYIRNEDYKVSINYDTGTIIDQDILTDDALKTINYFRKLDFKWGGGHLWLAEKIRYETYKITNYTEDTIFSQSTEFRFLNVNIKDSTLYYKIDGKENGNSIKETATYICRSANGSKGSNSTLRSILKMLR